MGFRREISTAIFVALLVATQLFLGATAEDTATGDKTAHPCENRRCDILTMALVNSATPAAQYHNTQIILKRAQHTKDTLYDAYCMMQALDRAIGAESWALLFENGFEFGEYCCFPCAPAFNATIQEKILESIKSSEEAAAAAAEEKAEKEPKSVDETVSTKGEISDSNSEVKMQDAIKMPDLKSRLQGSEKARTAQKKRKPHRKPVVKKPVQIIDDDENDEDIE